MLHTHTLKKLGLGTRLEKLIANYIDSYFKASILLVCFVNSKKHCAHVRVEDSIVVPIPV